MLHHCTQLLQTLTYFLKTRDGKEPSTSTLTLIRLVELVLTLNSFSFNNEYYRQFGAVAMGSGMGPCYAYLFIGYVEHQLPLTFDHIHMYFVQYKCQIIIIIIIINNTHNYLHFSSFHLHYCKRSISSSQFLRLRPLCTSLCDQGRWFRSY